MQRRRLQRLVLVASGAAVAVVVGVGAVALRAMVTTHAAATHAARADLDALADATRLFGLLYQKGFASEYLLTGDKRFLAELDVARDEAQRGLAGLTQPSMTPEVAAATSRLLAEYGRYDADRARVLAQAEAGQRQAAVTALPAVMARGATLRHLGDELIALRRQDVIARLEQADAAASGALVLLFGSMGLGLFGVIAVGVMLSRRVARPLYELVLRASSAAGGARVEVSADDEIEALAGHVALLARRIEESSTELATQRGRLVQAEKMSALGEMATFLAHEVLNPLAGIKTAVQLLARTERTAAVSATAAEVDGEIERVERLARALMSFARPLHPRATRTAAVALLERVAASTQAEAARRGVRVETALDGVEALECDADLVTQALGNLAVNACQAMSDGGCVRVRARRVEGATAIDVVDEGRGLAPEMAGRLFVPFATSKPDGHGLGLALAQSVALAHGGRIEAHANAPAAGMTFTMVLPDRTQEGAA